MNFLKTIRTSITGLLLLAGVAESRAQSVNLAVLHQFTAANNDGASPYSELTQAADGFLYGTTWAGGNAAGLVFRMNTDGSGFTLLHDFGSPADGSAPYAGVIQAADGFLYGTTYYGGTNSNGTIFKINTNGTAYSVIYRFTNSPDGAYPYSALIQAADGLLYGTTCMGGTNGYGTVFKINTDGSAYSVLHSFSTDAMEPFGQLVQASNGMLYGTTYSGGTSFIGAVFQINTNGSNYSVLHSFNGRPDGFTLQCGLLLGQDGWLYGTTVSGGDSSSGAGTVFKLNTNGAEFAVLRTFTNSPDGAYSYARLAQGNDGFLYGVTSAGGNTNAGTIFRLNTNGANYSILHSFNGDGDGQDPMAGLCTTGNGVFYGTALMGGSTNAGFGTVYRLALVPTLNLNIPPASPPLLTLSGFPGQPCQIQVSSNLINWNILANLSLTNGTAQLFDPTWTNSPIRFYRALVP